MTTGKLVKFSGLSSKLLVPSFQFQRKPRTPRNLESVSPKFARYAKGVPRTTVLAGNLQVRPAVEHIL